MCKNSHGDLIVEKDKVAHNDELWYSDNKKNYIRIRQIFGWSVIVFSDLAFAAVTIFSMKGLFVSESDQQLLVNRTMLLSDLGLALVLLTSAILRIWCLTDLFIKRGRWLEELEETGYDRIAEGKSGISKAVQV
ncbi:MAG: hypothetical protein JSV42_06510 [Chloroflexota bacterium]|nr:MAG: hypothetical protein JSV42_06510 [Chloroflexota bacterium]